MIYAYPTFHRAIEAALADLGDPAAGGPGPEPGPARHTSAGAG